MKAILPMIALAIAALTVRSASAEQDQAAPAARSEAPSAAHNVPGAPAPDARSATIRGEIESVDRETRTITLKDKEGRISMFRAGPQFKDFDRLEKGEKVVLRYAEAMLVSIGKLNAPPQAQTDTGAGKSAAADSAQPRGTKPAQTMATVTDVDAAHDTIRLSAPNGEELRLSVRDKSDIAGLQKGDEVSVTYVEPFALSVREDDGSTAEAGTGDGDRDATSPHRR